ncbi:type VI secretion system ImpG/VasA family protein [Burkholderia sp. HI2714]|uniref:type VI secretion system baseplate subunit TssF n=1 Tax=Burkholderia sp. HI2714 TaxID=2015359 RepID=UPI000B79E561|nr:type VI secretion system baseplate subunit TssF [Burkholderia sp. HI2714]OXJ26214.1 type VI secretion system ImpG/VasA family protein [Burkholderia sp. HI2714]
MSPEDLLPYYERELTFLRQYVREFAAHYPKIASRLSLTGGMDSGSMDLHVERLVESFALMAARTARSIDDDYPRFTEALFETLYPHYLRAFPSCSIAHFEMDSGRAAQMSAAVTVPRGTQLYSRPLRGSKILFRTAYDVTLSPLQLTAAQFRSIADVPRALRLPAGATALISLTFAIQSAHPSIAELNVESVRLYTQGTPVFTAVLRDALSMKALRAYVEPAHGGRWIELDGTPCTVAGMDCADSLVPYPESAASAYLLLTEFFAYPEKFGFFDCDLRQAGRLGGRQFTIHVVLKDMPAESAAAQALATLDERHLVLGCTPVVNLFDAVGKLGERSSTSDAADAYALEADEQSAHACAIYSVDSVAQVKALPQGNQAEALDPLHSLRHGRHGDAETLYWQAGLARRATPGSPGADATLTFVSGALAHRPPPAALAIRLTCSNGDLPERLDYGSPMGDLMMEGGSLARRIALLHRPTRPLHPRHERGAQWRLISQLSLNAVSLTGGAGPVRELLALHDLQRSAASVRLIDGVVKLTQHAVTAWVTERHFAGIVRGIELHLTVDEDAFAGMGTGIHAFVQIMDRLLRLHVTTSSFTQLIVFSSRTGDMLLRCSRCAGNGFLT